MDRLLLIVVAFFAASFLALFAWVLVRFHTLDVHRARCEAAGGYWLDAQDAHTCLDPRVVLHP